MAKILAMDKVMELSDFFPAFSLEKETLALAKRVKDLRKRNHYTQAEMSDRSGVTLASIKRFERTGEISLRHLWQIAEALGYGHELKNLFVSVIPTRREIWGKEDL